MPEEPVMTTILTNEDSTRADTVMEESGKDDLKTMLFERIGVNNSKNPFICIAHLLFKIAAGFIYLFGGLFFNSVFIFIIVSILSVIDFWIVKNLSGRYLVGLRWWTSLDDKGKEKWSFESFDKEITVNRIDYVFFWYGQASSTLFWMFLCLIKILSLSLFWVS